MKKVVGDFCLNDIILTRTLATAFAIIYKTIATNIYLNAYQKFDLRCEKQSNAY